jgi:hypothetical protein
MHRESQLLSQVAWSKLIETMSCDGGVFVWYKCVLGWEARLVFGNLVGAELFIEFRHAVVVCWIAGFVWWGCRVFQFCLLCCFWDGLLVLQSVEVLWLSVLIQLLCFQQ